MRPWCRCGQQSRSYRYEADSQMRREIPGRAQVRMMAEEVLEQGVEAEADSVVVASEEVLGAGPPLLVLRMVMEVLPGLLRQ